MQMRYPVPCSITASGICWKIPAFRTWRGRRLQGDCFGYLRQVGTAVAWWTLSFWCKLWERVKLLSRLRRLTFRFLAVILAGVRHKELTFVFFWTWPMYNDYNCIDEFVNPTWDCHYNISSCSQACSTPLGCALRALSFPALSTLQSNTPFILH